MIRALFVDPGGVIRFDVPPADFASAVQQEGGLLWVDMSEEPPDDAEQILRESFNFHPLAIDDALQEVHVPKVDDWGDYAYLVLHSVSPEWETSQPLHMLELDIFLGANYLVTSHEQPIPAVDRLQSLCHRDERRLKRGADYLLYLLVDELVADYMPLVETLDDAIEDFEDEVFDRHDKDILQRLFSLKRALLHLRRILTPQREVLNKLSRGDYAVIAPDHRVYFRDVYDHLVRLHDINETMRDLVSTALETYLSVINNRINDVMKTLTVITTLFMPVSFIASFFGMNFFQPSAQLEGWTGRPVFFLALGVTLLLPLGLYVWIRRRTEL